MATNINSNAQKGRQAIEFIIQKMNSITNDTASTVKSKDLSL
jgi:hypothetical protein